MHFGRNVLERLSDRARQEGRDDVADQIDHAMTQPRKALPWADILTKILPLIIGLFTGGKLDWSAILQAILDLFKQKSISPA